MTKKRTSLEEIFRPTLTRDAVPEEVQPVQSASEDKRRPLVKQQTVYLPLAVHEQMRKLAFEEKAKMHDLLIEGLELVFTKRGLPSVTELTGTRVSP